MLRLVCCATAIAALGVATPVARVAPDDTRLIEHVLNRLGYGPRPGDIERVRQSGIQQWIAAQLRPEPIESTAVDARIARFETLGLDMTTIFRDYYRPAIEERRRRQREPPQPDTAATSERPGAARDRRTAATSDAAARNRQVLAELEEARILRAVYSERQLEETLVDFWFNHFNVFAAKGPTRAFVTSYERDVIRPHVFGTFREMLEAVARSPAMLFYLDNWMSRSENLRASNQRASNPRASNLRGSGLNENFARELLELHTLGVDGGYTQNDVVNVARAFTGWTFGARQGTGFRFASRLHDQGEKVVLGHRIKAGSGISDGRTVLDILASHPSTARFIAGKLVRKFVSDTPPPALVDRAALAFTKTGGNLREVTQVIVTSPEFLAPEAYRAKVKTPLELVASALRATDADVQAAQPVARSLRELGMPLYFCLPPTGYDETGSTWVSSGALVARMNFGLALGANRLEGVSVPIPADADIATIRVQILEQALPSGVSDSTLTTVRKASTAAQVVGLVIGSPEFQKQ